ncbi:DNA polymerase III subunit gamma/tau [Hellea balneolensis]|uniref:DNA polymerase III subunit gamma/tau n=1 Tax=Hellea balneolensis TaxID=287478 RepID=UPI0004066493|nr:DNA polymerase III subunit gamma/tau [Hellea balneolensis]
MNDTSNQTYQVLARKYRPTTFEDMIGQEAMVTTLQNAFKAGRVAHAFMLTGVRGIGKTTTARLLARALNYQSDTVAGPSVELGTPGKHCELIMSSSHMDVLEMDAASRTGVENMREMLDGVRYAPATARYKVYIIDEVHMLSAGAFNALLKTLEEPPDHAKFIFATTEIRKVPITVLSRCQRFDLRRVEADALHAHLSKICDKEGAKVSDEGLALISRAAEGSVRDSLSLLDQAIVQSGLDGGEVTGDQVRTMLGLADRVRILDLFTLAATGDGKGALTEMRSQYDDGAAPDIVMRDMLDICHEVSRAKTLGPDAAFDAAPDQIARLQDLAEKLSLGQLTRIWQMLLKAHNEVRMAPAPLAAAEMALLKLSVAGQMPPPELAAQIIEQMKAGGITPPIVSSSAPTPASPTPPSTAMVASSGGGGVSSAPVPVTAPQAAPTPKSTVMLSSLEDLIEALPKSQIALKSDIKRYVRPIRFKQGSISFQPADGAPVSLTGKIVSAIKELTGELWIVSPETTGGGATLNEIKKDAKAAQDAKDRAHPAFNHPLLANARLIEIRETEPTSVPSNIIDGNFGNPEE